jgi:Tfp pilus assembly protein PilO|tara:strand:- start:6 stop:647 length:642 start_codon:yes stop_codon:yes gene_type:complete
MDLNNLSIDDLKEKILSFADKKTLIKFGIGFGAIILFLIIYFMILSPMVEKREMTYIDQVTKSNEISEFKTKIINTKKRINKIKPVYEKTSTLFHSKAEVEDLYSSLSVYAERNGLTISKIEKKEPNAVMKKGQAKQSKDKLKIEMVSYYVIPVVYEIKGNFLGYIKFKRAVSKSKKSLNFNKEEISVVQSDSTGAIVAKGELTIVGLPNDFF